MDGFPAWDGATVLVVGGGVAGLSLLYALAKRGLRPRLVEGGRIGAQGASSVPAALINPHRGRSARARDSDRAGMEALWRLARELEAAGLEPGAHRTGVLRLASSERQARSWRTLPGVVWLERPPFPYRAPHGGFLVEDGGWVEPGRLLRALAEGAARLGAQIHEGVRLEGLERARTHWRVGTSRGTMEAGTVVLCIGSAQLPGIALPELERLAGDVVTLHSPVTLPHPVAGATYAVARSPLLFVGGNHRPAGEGDPQAPMRLRSSAGRMVEGLREAPIAGVWTGTRAKLADNSPLLQEIAPRLWFFGALAGRGFLTAGLLAEGLADRIAEGIY